MTVDRGRPVIGTLLGYVGVLEELGLLYNKTLREHIRADSRVHIKSPGHMAKIDPDQIM
jgi:hypothetical protein